MPRHIMSDTVSVLADMAFEFGTNVVMYLSGLTACSKAPPEVLNVFDSCPSG